MTIPCSASTAVTLASKSLTVLFLSALRAPRASPSSASFLPSSCSSSGRKKYFRFRLDVVVSVFFALLIFLFGVVFLNRVFQKGTSDSASLSSGGGPSLSEGWGFAAGRRC